MSVLSTEDGGYSSGFSANSRFTSCTNNEFSSGNPPFEACSGNSFESLSVKLFVSRLLLLLSILAFSWRFCSSNSLREVSKTWFLISSASFLLFNLVSSRKSLACSLAYLSGSISPEACFSSRVVNLTSNS
jgi:hypothetical protein